MTCKIKVDPLDRRKWEVVCVPVQEDPVRDSGAAILEKQHVATSTAGTAEPLATTTSPCNGDLIEADAQKIHGDGGDDSSNSNNSNSNNSNSEDDDEVPSDLRPRVKQLASFDPARFDWPSYEMLIECFFRTYNINDDSAKIAVLKQRGGEIVRRILNDSTKIARTTSSEVNSSKTGFNDKVSADDAVRLLRVALTCENRIAANRLEFFRRIQRKDERVTTFIEDLKRLAKTCHFSKVRECVRDQIIAGVRSDEIRQRLLCERGRLTMPKMIRIAQLWEELLEPTSPTSTQATPRRQRSVSPQGTFLKMQSHIQSLACDEQDEDDDDDAAGDDEKQNRAIRVPKVFYSSVAVKNIRIRKNTPKPKEPVIDHNVQESGKITSGHTDVSAEEDATDSSTVKVDDSVRAKTEEDTKVAVPKKRGRPRIVSTLPGVKRFQCQYCDYRSDIRRSVQRHEMIHTGEKPHPCRFCSLSFRERQHLKNHERTHTGEQPYVCKLCGRGFAKGSTLNDHIRTHTREAPHLCEFCGRGFIQKSALNTHKMTHTGSRPHVCNVCRKGFTTSNLLKSHMRVHKERPLSTSRCESKPQAGSLTETVDEREEDGRMDQDRRLTSPESHSQSLQVVVPVRCSGSAAEESDGTTLSSQHLATTMATTMTLE